MRGSYEYCRGLSRHAGVANVNVSTNGRMHDIGYRLPRSPFHLLVDDKYLSQCARSQSAEDDAPLSSHLALSCANGVDFKIGMLA